MNRKLLVIEDDVAFRESLEHLLEHEHTVIKYAANACEALEDFAPGFDIALLSAGMSGGGVLELQTRLQSLDPGLPIIVTAEPDTIDRAFQALERGAYYYLVKPVHPAALLQLIANAIDHGVAQREIRALRDSIADMQPRADLAGCSAAANHLMELIAAAAANDAPVLITGELGTGKKTVARAIHAVSARRKKPLVMVQCCAFSDAALQSELFGAEGAAAGENGKFRKSAAGTLFLDHLDAAGSNSQRALLGILRQNGAAGAASTRCIAATTKDVGELVAAGAFNAELCDCFATNMIRLQPLRDRREDTAVVAEFFSRTLSESMNRPTPAISAAAMDMLCAYDWPGNAAELRNAIERALILNGSRELKPEHFALGMPAPAAPQTIDQLERLHIERTIRECGGNMSQTARVLGIDRTTLYHKLKRYRAE